MCGAWDIGFTISKSEIICLHSSTFINSQTVFTRVVKPNCLLLLRLLCTVLGTSLLTVSNSCSIQSTTNDVVTGTGQVLYSSASNENHAMLLKVVTFTGNVAGYFNTVRKTNSGDLTQSGVRLLRGSCLNSGAYASLLRSGFIRCLLVQRVVTLLQSRCCRLLLRSLFCLFSLTD